MAVKAGLSDHDSAIWRTLQINDLIDAHRFAEAPTVPTPFPPSLAAGERVVALGTFVLSEFAADGDGTYLRDSSFFFATGRYGLAMTAGAAIGRAIGNAARRNAARAAAIPRWRPIDQGLLYVSDWGFYMHSHSGLHSWTWEWMTAAQLVGPRSILFVGTSSRGPVHWRIDSDWAELTFTLWARARHPQHPQLAGGTWIPSGWADRIAASQYEPPANLSGRWTGHMLPSGKD